MGGEGKGVSPTQAEAEKRRVALSSVAGGALLTGLKVVVGLLTGSLGILAEAAHSGLDLAAALITYFAVRLSSKAPDADHLYGHGRVENFSALVETLFLLITCAWIIFEAFQRLFFKTVEIEVNLWAFLVMAISIVVDLNRSRALAQAAHKYHSQALEADALHFQTDIWSSSVVILGLLLALLGRILGQKGLLRADALAALAVAMIVIYVSLSLGKRTIDALLDRAPLGLGQRIAENLSGLPGVEKVVRVRVRAAGPYYFVDLVVGAARSASFEQVHALASQIEERVKAFLPRADVMVHVDPMRGEESIVEEVRTISRRQGLTVHDISVHDLRGELFINLDLELPEALTLEEGHGVVDGLEGEIAQELGPQAHITVHMEPERAQVPPGQMAVEAAFLRAKVKEVAEEMGQVLGCHKVVVQRVEGELVVTLHCVLEKDLSVGEAHEVSRDLEKRLRAEVPILDRVLVHLEPPGK